MMRLTAESDTPTFSAIVLTDSPALPAATILARSSGPMTVRLLFAPMGAPSSTTWPKSTL